MTVTARIAQVAVPVPLRRLFDYLVQGDIPAPEPGARVRIPFGRRSMVGVVVALKAESERPRSQLKPIAEVLDSVPMLSTALLKLLTWSASYYHHPIGEVMAAALPGVLRTRALATTARIQIWKLTPSGTQASAEGLKRAVVQKRVLTALQAAKDGLNAGALSAVSPRWRAATDALIERRWVVMEERDAETIGRNELTDPPVLSEPQAAAVDAVAAASGFKPFVLYGVTGSGKTEVYLRVIEQVLARGRQVLVLVPEIGLTPQVLQRFRERLREPIGVLHSGLSEQERANTWLLARDGRVRIVIGTRSAVFTPLPQLGIVIVDEEHDASFKQQDGFRYSARDVAVMRANQEGVPIVLGSATPSLETLNRVREGSYVQLTLPNRAGGAELPQVDLLDMRKLSVEDGLSHPLRTAIAETLNRGEQALLFLNRRGFAPVWMCFSCGWIAPCRRCDARMTFHRASSRLRCHHCGADHPLPAKCPDCGATELRALGEGTERVETSLARFFPSARIVRIDRDTTRTKGALADKLGQVHRGEADILVGTQMLSKGHDFPDVTLVGVLNADQGLYGSDFRAAERLVQQIVQVSGRAGRAAKAGRVLIQTYHPGHPVFAALQARGYDNFAKYALLERQETGYPPFTHIALLRAESPSAHAALTFLRNARALAQRHISNTGVQLMDPVPSPMERRAGRYRAQLLVQSSKRAPLHAMLALWLDELGEQKTARHVRWSVDVDPADLY